MGPPTRLFRSQCLCQLTWFYTLLWFFLLFCLFSTGRGSTTKISYTDHCAAIVPEASPTVRASSGFPQLEPATRYYMHGGDKILGEIKSSSHHYFNGSGPYVSFYPTRKVFETDIKGIYKVQASLTLGLPGAYLSSGNYSGYGQNYHPRSVHRPGLLKFFLHGFWSGNSGKLCMVGTASWPSGERKPLNLEAVFVYDHAKKNPTVFTSMAKGTLKSLSSSNTRAYFEPIEIVSFPSLDDYVYTLASKGVRGGCLGGADIPPRQYVNLQPESVCSTFLWQSYEFDLEYVTGCKGTRNCGPLEEDLPYLSLYGFQCLKDEEKLRYLVSFQSTRYHWRHQSFDPNRTFIGEGSWDSKKNQVCIVVCRILNPFKSLEDVHVGDCSTRLSLGFPVVWTIKDSSSIVGLVWTNKTSADPGYFKPIKFSSSNPNSNGVGLPGLRYEYTETDKVRELCPKKEAVHKSGDKYPGVSSYDMSFDFNVHNSKVKSAWGYAIPISVGDELYQVASGVISVDPGYGEEDATSASGQMNASYKLTFYSNGFRNQVFLANSSFNYEGQVEISAEGVYDTTTGRLCMVGCRGLHQQNTSVKSLDCEMLIDLQFPPLNSRVGSSIKGYIQSRRAETDPLYFKLLNISAFSFYRVQEQQSIWRMDLEIVLVFISNTLLCIFLASQIFHVKKRREVLPLISLAMLIVLSVGHMIPLVLNVEALLLNSHDQQQLVRRGDGWFELNEVMSVRLVTLVVFLLLLRLLQLAWTARMENGDDFWGAEKKAIFLILCLYAAGGLITLLVEWRSSDYGDGILPVESADSPKRSISTYLEAYAGLILDWFLFPQIILNAFQNSRESALSGLFYVGTTLVRLVPHAYDLYRVRYYVSQEFDGSYVYANPNADFYSIAWDVIIPCGCILLAVIIWLQQRFGGRCILPGKIQELGSYDKVPTISTE